MAEQLTYDFRIIGQSAINAALAGVERRYVEHNRRMTQATRQATGATSQRQAKSRVSSEERETLLRQKVLDREHERSMRERTRMDTQRLREVERTQRKQTRIEEQEARKRATIARTESRQADAARMRFRSRTAHAVTGAFGRSVSTVGSWAAGAGTLLGGIGAGMAVSSQMGLLGRASALANQAGTPARKGEILGFSQTIQGVSGEQAIGALEQWQMLTGQLDVGMQKLQEFNELSLATGTDLADMTSAAASAFTTLATDIKDPKDQMKALSEVMRTFAAQGAIGAVELKQLATEMPGLAATASKFGKDRALAMRELGAIAQVARAKGGASSTPEVITALERFGSEVIAKESDLKAMGVDVWGDKKLKGKGKLKTVQELMVQIISKSKGDISKLGGVFNERSIRAVQGFASVYQAAESTKKGTGEAAVRAQFGEFLGPNVQLGEEEIKKRSASRLADPDLMLAEAVKKFKYSIGTELLPVLSQLVPEIAKLTPAFTGAAKAAGGFITWATKHPAEGVGVTLAALMAKDIAASGIGAATRTALETGLKTGMGKLGAAGLALTVGTATFMVTTAMLKKFVSEPQKARDRKSALEPAEREALLGKASKEIEKTGSAEGKTKIELGQRVEQARRELRAMQERPPPELTKTAGFDRKKEELAAFIERGQDVLGGRSEVGVQGWANSLNENAGYSMFSETGDRELLQRSREKRGAEQGAAVGQYGTEDFAAWIANMQSGSDSLIQFTQDAESAAKKLRELGIDSPNRGNSPTAPR